ncbi:hydantoinase B/oxoprolinase family protein [Paralcaligenes sp. KSB-10]|uniref:hydantoinase B/oxoprolinase family protein n=1 Tax=Paralcaligenes sp. KSB-10 TaxID=2901142 RepID=UPI001E49228F|nr:hydantoinase B/oxoprolinase family protein [Paralcaligenes sp. KSB-10]UHL63969.1 hydantoinase B/oxoprolinase family protein [Paralcaligenes sp. KSB-10]
MSMISRTGTTYRVGVDTGGTFTDLIVLGDDGSLFRRKVLSTPEDFSRGILGALTEVFGEFKLSGGDLNGFIHGTTVATNAILEGTGPQLGLLTTKGFCDVLEIGRGGWGADVHDLRWVKPAPLVQRAHRLEIDERMSARGEVLRAPERADIEQAFKRLQAQGISNVAICLINSYVDPTHEQLVQTVGQELFPDMTICRSTEVLGEAREYERTSTTVINTYLMPVVDHYLRQLQEALISIAYRGDVLVMQSNGGLISAELARQRPVNIVESGPAAGVLAACYLAQQTGERNLIAFDMGGTTAKATLIENGKPFESSEYHVGGGMSHSGGSSGGHVIRVPSIEIAEVGAGGGSIAWLDAGGALRVGPRSAGAAPGPACYDQGGTEPTVTDAYATMGYINPNAIAGGAKSIVVDLAREAIAKKIAHPAGLSVEQAAYGIYAVATSNMIRAVRAVSVERGRDARDYTLVAFGGAGPLHAAELGRAMGLKHVLVPNSPGLFSALGLLMADVQQKGSRTVLQRVNEIDDAAVERLNQIFADLQDSAMADLLRDDLRSADIVIERSATMQYVGQSFELFIDAPLGKLDRNSFHRLAEKFCEEHQRTYGYQEDLTHVQIVSLRITARDITRKASYAEVGRQSMQETANAETVTRDAYFGPDAGWQKARVIRRSALRTGSVIGPAIVEELDTTIVIPPQCSASLDDFGNVIIALDTVAAQTATSAETAEINAMSLELVKNSLDSITDNMAGTLARTARSLIVRDSHDFSVALCNAEGELVTGGVGIAVHLGSIPNALMSLPAEIRVTLEEGDLIIMNDPYAGGMHLPDFFVFKPIFLDGKLAGFAAAVAHMADVGGRVPGGNAADSTEIFQEGIRIPPCKLYARGILDQNLLNVIRANVRHPDILMADLYAEIAACNTAEAEFQGIARRLGAELLGHYMHELIDYGERMARAALQELKPGRYCFVDYIDDDGVGGDPVRIQVEVNVSPEGIAVDFTGTSPQVRSAINAPLSITRTAVAFVVKAIIGREIPNNSGFLHLLSVTAPKGSIVNMAFPAACAARAVTAYRVTDALFGAFAPLRPERVPAAGDGGPAVISVGGEDQDGVPFVFMELISGAFGGRPGLDGLEGVASPIVDAQNTSCELIEATYPLRVEHYGFVPNTGGVGQFRGGLAVRRDVRFLGRRAVLQIRSDRAVIRPWGLAGGGPGSNSKNALFSQDGAMRDLPSKIVTEIESGSMWRHVTASGGGWGDPHKRTHAAIDQDLQDGKMRADDPIARYDDLPQ